MNETKSQELFKRALQVIPGGVNSPVRAFKSVGGTPIYMKKGEGCHLFDADGNKYLDFCNSWGPLIAGHRHPSIVAAIQDQSTRALTVGTCTEEEVLLAEFIVNRLSSIGVEQVRFVSSGTEAVMSAVRVARGYTKRSKIIKF